jgi:hypothetical protein
MSEKKNGGDKEPVQDLAELANTLGLRDAEGNLDLEAAGRVAKSEAEAAAAKAKSEAEAKKAAEPKAAEPAKK